MFENRVNAIFYVGFTTCTLSASFIFYKGINTDDVTNIFSIICGFLLDFTGVAVLTLSKNESSVINRRKAVYRPLEGADDEDYELQGTRSNWNICTSGWIPCKLNKIIYKWIDDSRNSSMYQYLVDIKYTYTAHNRKDSWMFKKVSLLEKENRKSSLDPRVNIPVHFNKTPVPNQKEETKSNAYIRQIIHYIE